MKSNMMKTSMLSGALLAAGLLTASSAIAKPAFLDAYTIKGGNYLSSRVVSGDLAISKISNTSFSVTNKNDEDGGNFEVAIGADNSHKCTLTIIDARYQVPMMAAGDCTSGYSVKHFNANYNYVHIEIGHKK